MSRPNELIQLYLTNICNSGCKTCNIWRNRNVQELPVDIVLENILKCYPNADYVFGGGEFTLYSQRDILLQYCDEHNINYTVLSNAVRLPLLKDLVMDHNVKNLTISCDGIKHDEIRGVTGNLRNIEYVIKQFHCMVDNIKISYTLSKFNESCIDNDMAYFRALGIKKIYFCIAQNMDLLNASGDITPNIQSLKYMYESYGYMLYDKDLQMLEDFINGIHKRCDSTNDVHTIYTNGDVVRCQSYLSKDVLGNIKEDKLSKILLYSYLSKDFNCQYFNCPYNDICELACQRRYDYEDRV